MSDEENVFRRRLAEKARRAAWWLATEEGRAEEAAIRASEQRLRRALLARLADEAGVPHKHELRVVALADAPLETQSLNAFREALAWREARRAADGTESVVRVVSGPAGTGKSCGLGWAVTHHVGSARWVDAATLAVTPRNGWSRTDALWEEWLTVDLLAIDDLGTEPADVGALGWLITERYNRGLATFATANISPGEYAKRYADTRQADRLENGQKSSGLPWYVSVRGDSLRNPTARAALARKEMGDE